MPKVAAKHRVALLLALASAFCWAGEPVWFESLDLLIGAQPEPGRAEGERRLQESRDPLEQRWLRALVAQAYAERDPGGALQLFEAVEREARAVADDDLLVLAVTRHALLLDTNAQGARARTQGGRSLEKQDAANRRQVRALHGDRHPSRYAKRFASGRM